MKKASVGLLLLCWGVAACCSVLPCVAACGSVLQMNSAEGTIRCIAAVLVWCDIVTCSSVLQCCSVLPCVAACCGVLQCAGMV